jgi:uncharacterized membrane protein
MRGSRSVAVVAVFTALVVGSDFALTPFSNVKLLDTLVFVAAYVFGFRTGALIGVLSETIWSFVSPVGIAGPVAPFLIAGELLFALAGWGAARAWGRRLQLGSPYTIFIGAAMLICAFLWDLETNFAYALFAFKSPTLYQFLWAAFNPLTIPFILAHEGSDFVFGVLLVPAFILVIPKAYRGLL